jgi:predicted transcriptional regulator
LTLVPTRDTRRWKECRFRIDIGVPNLYLQEMDTIPLKPERLAQLEDLARRRGKSTADALDDALADYLEWERQDYQEAVDAVRQGHEDVKAGRTAPADQFFDEFARKHGLPR